MAVEKITVGQTTHTSHQRSYKPMKTLRNALLLGLAALALSPVGAADNQTIPKDLAQLQGEWSMVSGSADGFPIPDEMLPNSKRICEGDELTVTVGGQLVMKAKITIDPAKKPKTIDYQVFEGPTKGKTHLGIYEIEGDTMRSCFAAPGEERPADFTSKPGERRTLTVWKRAKAAAPKEKN